MLLAHSFVLIFYFGSAACLSTPPRISSETTTTTLKKKQHKKNQPQHNHKRKYLFALAFPSIYCMKILFNFFFWYIFSIVCWCCGCWCSLRFFFFFWSSIYPNFVICWALRPYTLFRAIVCIATLRKIKQKIAFPFSIFNDPIKRRLLLQSEGWYIIYFIQ